MDEFIVRALLAGLLVVLVSGPLGCVVIWRRMAYFGDALAHAALLGTAIALMMDIRPLFGVIGIGVVISYLLMRLQLNKDLSIDAILGILSHGALATDGSSVKRFHSRLFQAAIDAGVKVQPIALRYPYHNGINPYVPYIEQMTFMQSVLGLMHSKTLQVELNFLPAIDAHLPGNGDDSPAPCSNKHLALLAQQAIALKLESNRTL